MSLRGETFPHLPQANPSRGPSLGSFSLASIPIVALFLSRRGWDPLVVPATLWACSTWPAFGPCGLLGPPATHPPWYWSQYSFLSAIPAGVTMSHLLTELGLGLRETPGQAWLASSLALQTLVIARILMRSKMTQLHPLPNADLRTLRWAPNNPLDDLTCATAGAPPPTRHLSLRSLLTFPLW